MPLNPLSASPNFDFKPDTGLIQAYTNATQQKIQNDVSQQQSQSANILKTVEMASQLAQTFVEQSKQRQQVDAVKAYASFNPNQKVSRATPLPVGQQGPMNIEQTTLGATPEGKQQQLRLLADVMGTAPTTSAESIIKSQIKPGLTGSAARSSAMALELPNGEQVLGYFDPTAPENERFRLQDGTPAPMGTKRSYKFDLREDSSGNLVITSGASGKRVGGVNLSGSELRPEEVGTVNSIFRLPPKESAAAGRAIDEYTKEPTVRAARSGLLQTNVVINGLESRNFVFDEKLGLQLARTFGDAGNISIVEQEVGRESRQIVEKGKQLLERYIKTGELTEENRKEVVRALKTLQYAQLQKLQNEADIVVDRVTGEEGEIPRLNRDAFKKKLIGPKLQKEIDSAIEQLERLDDVAGDIDITSGSKPGEKGQPTSADKKAALKKKLGL